MSDSPDKHVTYAISRLHGDARAWYDNDPYLGMIYGRSGINCPAAVFKQRFFQRFVLHDSTKNAYEDWYNLQQDTLDLQAFNDKFNAALQLIAVVPNGTAVDGASQVRRYLEVIRPAIRRKALDFFNDSYLSNLPATMALAIHAEHLLSLAGKVSPGIKRTAVIAQKPKKRQKDSSNSTTFADTSTDWNTPPTSAVVPINNIATSASPDVSTQEGALPMGRHGGRAAGRGGRQHEDANRGRGRGGGRGRFPPRGGRGGGRRGGRSFQFRRVSAPAAPATEVACQDMHIWPPVASSSFPVHGNPYVTSIPAAWQPAQPAQMPAHAQRFPTAYESGQNAHVPTFEHDPAVHMLATPARHKQSFVMASTHLSQAYDPTALHMIFTASLLRGTGGRKRGQKLIKALIDSGSQRSCINAQKTARWSTPNATAPCKIVFADGSSKAEVPSCNASFKLDGYTFQQDCLVVDTPSEFDVILGQDWINAHNADLLFSEHKLRFTELQSKTQHTIPVPSHLKEAPLNSIIANTIAQVQQSVKDGSNAADPDPVTHMFMVYVTEASQGSHVFSAYGTPAFELQKDVPGHVSSDNVSPHTSHINSAMMPTEAAPVDDEGSDELHAVLHPYGYAAAIRVRVRT